MWIPQEYAAAFSVCMVLWFLSGKMYFYCMLVIIRLKDSSEIKRAEQSVCLLGRWALVGAGVPLPHGRPQARPC